MTLMQYVAMRESDPLRPNLSSQMMQQDLINKGLNIAGLAPVGMTTTKAAKGLLGMRPLKENQFYNQYAQHIDLRGRGGKSDENMRSILQEGFKQSSNVNAMPVHPPGVPLNAITKKLAPKQGDVVYLVPREAYINGPNGLKIKEGWTPKPYEAIKITDTQKPMYEYYMEAINKGD
jgi:hypothetical protein